jgi:hypothetical protein
MTMQADMQEIRDLIETTVASGGAVKKAWLVHAICQRHAADLGSDWSWRRAYNDTDAMVRRIIGQLKQLEFETTPAQGELFGGGYERLQKLYTVERDGDSVIVAVEDMTDDELIAKEHEHDAASIGHALHRDELRRYRLERSALRGVASA